MGMVELIGCSLLGAMLPDVLRIIKSKYDPELPKYLTYLSFWLGLILLIIIGFVANLVSQPGSIKEAIAIAFGAPEIISKLFAKQNGNGGGGSGGGSKPGKSGAAGTTEAEGTKMNYSLNFKLPSMGGAIKPTLDAKKSFVLREWWAR